MSIEPVEKLYAVIGSDCVIQEGAIVGLQYRTGCDKLVLGDRATIRTGVIIYADVVIGDDFKAGHFAMIREKTKIGNKVVVGTNTVIDGNVEIGNFVKLESQVYIPTHTLIGSHVFIGPGAILTNDRYPQRLRDEYKPVGPTLEDGVTIGANATLLPGVRIGKGSMIGAGAVVTRDIPPWSLAIGVPAEVKPLPKKLQELNRAKVW